MFNFNQNLSLLLVCALFVSCNRKKNDDPALEEDGGAGTYEPATSDFPVPVQTPIKSTSIVPPKLTAPSSMSLTTSSKTLHIAGSCLSGATVELGGTSLVASDVTSPSASLTSACTAGQFAFDVFKQNDGIYTIDVAQVSGSARSSKVTISWTLDSTAPVAPSIGLPLQNPLVSSDSMITISGSCEPTATVNLSGAATQSVTCSDAGAFSFSVTAATDAIRNYALSQIDVAGNTSASGSFQWERNSLIPASLVVTSPALSPSYSSSGSVTISGQCADGFEVTLAGDVLANDVSNPSNSLTQVCASSSFSFTVAKSADADYGFQLEQKNLSNNLESPTVTIHWIRDTVAPSAPVRTSPVANPFVSMGNSLAIGGSCEASATVTLSGPENQTSACSSSGVFSFTVQGATDGTRNYTLTQTDRAGNTSSGATVQWVRDSSVPNAPTITSPASSPFYSSGASLTISGACTSGYNVVMSGAVSASDVTNPANSLVAVCTASTFSFTITKATNTSFDLQFKQVNTGNNNSSSFASLTWVRDTIAPSGPL